ncbi:UNVERIFIED_ORG: hypothetical protein M2348_001302 [Sphingomonas sp. R1F5B]
MSDQTKLQSDTALALAHFAASAAAVVASALHRGKSIEDGDIQHLLKILATSAASAPDQAEGYFHALAETLAGKHYEGG